MTIKNIFKSKETGYFHFLLELNEFFDCTISNYDSDKFVTTIAINEGINHSWLERVKAVKEHFDNVLFFKYELLSKDSNIVSPKFSKLNNDAIFYIDDETEYRLSFSFYDKLEGESSLVIEPSNYMDVYYKECSRIGTLIDDRYFKLLTRSVSQNKTPSTLRIRPKPTKDTNGGLSYEVVSFFEIRKSYSSTIIFGILSSFAFSAIIISQIIGAYAKLEKPICTIIWLSVLAFIIFGVAGSILFHRYNKK